MNGLGEIPKYVRYDFLITLIGLISLGSWWYFSIIIQISSPSINILFISGLFLVIWGFSEMYSNYEEEKSLWQLKIILDKKEIIDKLEKNKIIDKNKKEGIIRLLIKETDEIIGDKSKKN